jgi:hypothetical protein
MRPAIRLAVLLSLIPSCAVVLFLGCIVNSQAHAGPQQPIRVESSDVLIPVLVLDEDRINRIRKMDPHVFEVEATSKNAQLLTDLAVSGLTAKDFQVFEDGKRQPIERVTIAPDFGQARGAGDGKWVGPDLPFYTSLDEYPSILTSLPDTKFGPPAWLAYLISYAPPRSASGSCHQVVVKVNRPHSLVFTRANYCNASRPAADPLSHTKMGDQLEDIISSHKGRPSDVSVTAFNSFRGKTGNVTNVVVALPQEAQRIFDCDKPPAIEIMGIVYAENGMVVTRFSDLANLGLWSFVGVSLPRLVPKDFDSCTKFDIPYQYEAQVEVPPGRYTLRVAYIDDKRSGWGETPFAINIRDASRLSLSDLIIGKTYKKVQSGPRNDAALPGSYVPLVSNGFEVTPTAEPHFRKADPLAFYFEIYDPEAGPPANTLAAAVRILDAKSGALAKSVDPIKVESYASSGDPVIPVGGQISISDLPNGSYQLQVQVTASSQAGDTLTRTTDFTIAWTN